MTTIKRRCPRCKKEYSQTFSATEKTKVDKMGEAEKKLDADIESCDCQNVMVADPVMQMTKDDKSEIKAKMFTK